MGSGYSREQLITFTAEQISDVITNNIGEAYATYRNLIIRNGITGEVLQELGDLNEFKEFLNCFKEINLVHQKVLITHFKKLFLISELKVPHNKESPALPSSEITYTREQSPFIVFLTHDWGKDELDRSNHERVSRVNRNLKAAGIHTWFDEERMQQGNIRSLMATGVDQASAMIVFVTKRYASKVNGPDERDNCKYEFDYACRRLGPQKMIPVVMEPTMKNQLKWEGVFGATLGGKKYVDLTSDAESEFRSACAELCLQIKIIQNSYFSPSIALERSLPSLAPRVFVAGDDYAKDSDIARDDDDDDGDDDKIVIRVDEASGGTMVTGYRKKKLRDVILHPFIPDFSSIPYEEVIMFAMVMPRSVDSLLAESFDDECITSEFPEKDRLIIKCAAFPFASGETFISYYGQSMNCSVIIKQSVYVSPSELTKSKFDAMLSCHRAAKFLSDEFNRIKPSACPQIKFCDACIIQLMARRGQPFMILENQILEPFEKYNNNSGYCAPNPTSNGTNHDAIQAFSHWTYHITKQQLMVVDCKGGFNTSLKRFLLTDPSIHCIDLGRFGNTNLGKKGMERFFKSHSCNQYCRAMQLATLTA